METVEKNCEACGKAPEEEEVYEVWDKKKRKYVAICGECLDKLEVAFGD